MRAEPGQLIQFFRASEQFRRGDPFHLGLVRRLAGVCGMRRGRRWHGLQVCRTVDRAEPPPPRRRIGDTRPPAGPVRVRFQRGQRQHGDGRGPLGERMLDDHAQKPFVGDDRAAGHP
ncbi:hypothetical protein [Streptomyces europaeiscabiei]|uniref:hypothetical protein n=1 Tax=Streptomyces europaeiscabiei TaxID=146819 RepID=UPI001F167850|nr:hypothetical protein [Streptomyces europaeiscabiei]